MKPPIDDYLFIIKSIEAEVLENYPDNLSEWKIFIYVGIKDGLILYNDTIVDIGVFNDLLTMHIIKFNGIHLHQGEKHRRYKWAVIKYPEKYNRNATKDLRNFIFWRDSNKCSSCGTDYNLSIDHIIPWSLGGKTEHSNLQVLCRSCNSSKGNK